MVTRQSGGWAGREEHGAGRTDAGAAAGIALAFGAGTLILAAALAGNRRRRQLARVRDYPDSAPPRARRAVAGGRVLTGNAVRIDRPRQELYAFWRDFANLPRFMENVHEVERSTTATPSGRSRRRRGRASPSAARSPRSARAS